MSLPVSVTVNLLKLQGSLVQVEGSSVAFSDMQRNVFGIEGFNHGSCCLIHKLLCQSKSPMRSFDSQGSDVPVRIIVSLLLLHLGQDVADNVAGAVLGDVAELRPREAVVHVVLHLVVLRQAEQIAMLHVHQILGL